MGTDNQGALTGQRLAIFILACSALLASSAAAFGDERQANLANETLQDLMNTQVTTVSRTEQKLSQTASAVFVITQEDIARSGATNIPDLLRMVPGMDVAQINANTWAISARGFNARFANELQVLVDGRSVYTDSFGGVFWDQLDLPLEDIERIEVIRGPGGSVWGGNAVNGVINIVTKKASETRGAMVAVGGGTDEQGFGTVQYGGRAGKSTDYRVYSKYFNDGHLPDFSGGDGGDGWHMLRGGFRSDSTLTARDKLTFEGDIYTGSEGSPTTDLPSVTSPGPIDAEDIFNLSGGFLQGVWSHQYSTRSDSSLEVSFDRYKRNDLLHDHRGTLDVNFQHHFLLGGRQSVLWGGEYRLSMSKSDGSFYVSFVPADLNTALYSGFVEDQIAIVPNRVLFTAGARLEHNYYSGLDLMPSARVAWTMTTGQMMWASVSRAVRTPSGVDANLRANVASVPGAGGVPDLIAFIGNPNVKDEGLTAFEAGYRAEIAKTLALDLSSYYNLYDHQETEEPAAPFLENTPAPPHLVIPSTYENLMHGESDGLEMWADWRPASWWTLTPGYAFEQIHMHLAPGSQDTTSVAGAQGASPLHSAQLRSHVRVWRGFSWDVSSYFVDRLADPAEPSYTRVDTQVSWNFGETTTLSFVGQNLAQDHHEEFVDETDTERTTLIKRCAFVKFTARF